MPISVFVANFVAAFIERITGLIESSTKFATKLATKMRILTGLGQALNRTRRPGATDQPELLRPAPIRLDFSASVSHEDLVNSRP